MFGVVRQQRQLVQPLLKLRGGFRHCRASGGPPTGLAPIGDSLFSEPSLRIMLGEELGLVLHHVWGLGFERFGDPRMQLLPGAAQQAGVSRVLDQRVLEGIDCIRRRTSLEYEFGGDEPGERVSQFVLRKAGDGAQQGVGKLASNRRADLRDQPHRRQSVEPRHQGIV